MERKKQLEESKSAELKNPSCPMIQFAIYSTGESDQGNQHIWNNPLNIDLIALAQVLLKANVKGKQTVRDMSKEAPNEEQQIKSIDMSQSKTKPTLIETFKEVASSQEESISRYVQQ